ncbi:MAG TPA: hypothetical protein VFO80_03005 [Sphingomonas sp.]|nr:hypothetical protein [Sphingomonas sp.]
MNAPVKISDLLDPETSALVERLASERGTSVAAYVAEAIHWFAGDEAALAESLDEADRQIDRGEFYTQEEIEAWFAERRGTAADE